MPEAATARNFGDFLIGACRRYAVSMLVLLDVQKSGRPLREKSRRRPRRSGVKDSMNDNNLLVLSVMKELVLLLLPPKEV